MDTQWRGSSRLTKKSFVLLRSMMSEEHCPTELLANFMFGVDQNTTWLGYGVEQMFFYDSMRRRLKFGAALKTNTRGLVLAGSREAERITSQIRAGSANKETTKEGFSHIQHIFVFSVWLLSFDQYIDIPIKLFPKKWRTGVVQLSHATAIATHNGEKNTFWPSLLWALVQSVGGTKWHIKHIDHGGTF